MKHLFGTGFAFRDTFNGEFDPALPYTICRLCGAVYQHPLTQKRKAWSFDHSATHTLREHASLELSQRFVTPEAAHRLAAFGLIPISDMALSEEHARALWESSPVPR